jgi:hypothetical protein
MKIQDIEWPTLTSPVEGQTEFPMQFLRLDKKLEIVEEPFHSRAAFWKSLNLPPFKRNHDNDERLSTHLESESDQTGILHDSIHSAESNMNTPEELEENNLIDNILS